MSEEPGCRYRNKLLYYLSYITVEPIMVLYMMAFMTTTVIEQSFFVYKACTVNHGYNNTICENINEKQYENITKEVQVTVSTFHLWNNVAGHGVPIILALFIGAWSDRRGRKLPLLLGLLGKLYYSAMIVLNTTQPHWPLEYVIYTATLPMAFTGADVTIFATAFTYLVDISSQKYRTMRVTILEVCYLATMPTGIALGSYLFNKVVDKSYTIMFTINVSLMAIAVIYTLARLNWQSNHNQKPFSEADNKFLDFFDYNHVVNTVVTVCKKRPRSKRTYLIMMFVMMALYTFQRDERDMMYIYCQLVFNWTLAQFSKFRTFQSALQDVILLLAIPLMSSVLGWRDTIIVMIGAMAHTAARIFYSTAEVSWVFYTGGVFAAIGPIVAPVIRSIVSKIVSNSEKGKAFSVLAVADNAVPLVSGVAYSTVYNATIHYHPSAIFYLTMATQIGVFLLVVYIHVKTDHDEFEREAEVAAAPSDSLESNGAKDEGRIA
uniref:Proton-coupled folate transporter n=1 Tax=Anoplophora glabripennis TaxID=217634 RepID=V5I9A0_ANOGL